MKPHIRCYDEVWHIPTKPIDDCAHILYWHAVLLKHKLVLCFRLYKACEICFGRKFIEVCVCEKLSKYSLV